MSSHNDEWFDARKRPIKVEVRGPYVESTTIETEEGQFAVDQNYIAAHGGYYIICGVDDEIYPIGADTFEETYMLTAEECSHTPKYSEKDLRDAMDELRENTLDHVPQRTYSADARRGAEALMRLLRTDVETFDKKLSTR